MPSVWATAFPAGGRARATRPGGGDPAAAAGKRVENRKLSRHARKARKKAVWHSQRKGAA